MLIIYVYCLQDATSGNVVNASNWKMVWTAKDCSHKLFTLPVHQLCMCWKSKLATCFIHRSCWIILEALFFWLCSQIPQTKERFFSLLLTLSIAIMFCSVECVCVRIRSCIRNTGVCTSIVLVWICQSANRLFPSTQHLLCLCFRLLARESIRVASSGSCY